jgi:hypothetical protein
MSNAILITKLINFCILEFTSIVTFHLLDCSFKLILYSLDECLECCKHITLVNKKGYPSISSEIMHNHKATLVATNACISGWSK